MSMRRAVIMNYELFLVLKIEVENLISLSTQISLKSPWHNPKSKEHTSNNQIGEYEYVHSKYRTFMHGGFKKICKLCHFFFLVRRGMCPWQD